MTSSDRKNRIFGIDLGTTYSCIAYVNDAGKTEVVPNADGDLTTPSVVYFEDSKNVVVGKAAKEELKTSPDKVISLVKRSMGEKDARFSGVADVPLTPQEVSAHILRKLVQDAQDYTRQPEPIEDVVITCPAYFGFSGKEATRQAGEIAGLNVRYVIPEPTAAAIFYGMTEDTSLNQTVLVYDLGGGTFDVTVIDVKDGNIEVVCVGGDHDLGGANWDEDVATWFADKFSAEHGTKTGELMNSDETWQDLLGLAESAKRSLTAKTKHATRITHGTNRSRIELTREEFDEITEPRLNGTITLTENVLEKARAKGREQIDKILLVGGSTYMPQIQARLKKEFPSITEIGLLDPNQAVAKGAAVFGYKCFLDDEVMKKVAEHTGADMSGPGAATVPEEVRQRRRGKRRGRPGTSTRSDAEPDPEDDPERHLEELRRRCSRRNQEGARLQPDRGGRESAGRGHREVQDGGRGPDQRRGGLHGEHPAPERLRRYRGVHRDRQSRAALFPSLAQGLPSRIPLLSFRRWTARRARDGSDHRR